MSRSRTVVLASLCVAMIGSVINGAAGADASPPAEPAAPDVARFVWERRADALPVSYPPLMTYDAGRGRVVAVTSPPEGVLQTWEWDGDVWLEVVTGASPPARRGAVMEHDPVRDEIVLFGGEDRSGFRYDTWVLADGEWTERRPASWPTLPSYGVAAFDPNLGKIVLFGGLFPDGSARNWMWTWDGTTWTRVYPELLPERRVSSSLSYDARHGGLVLYGGWEEDGGYSHPVGDTWLWDGTSWRELDVDRRPGKRYGMSSITVDGRAAIFGGSTGGVGRPARSHASTWVLGDDGWRRLRVDGRPLPSPQRAETDLATGEVVANLRSGEDVGTWVLGRAARTTSTDAAR